MATTIVTKNSSTAAAVPTAAQLVQGELAVNVADKRLYTEDNVGGIVELGTNPATEITANAGIALPDSQKATFGAGDDLQIYHDGTDSYISDQGTGRLKLRGSSQIRLETSTGTQMISADDGGAAKLYHNGVKRLDTTSTGIDVTGTATMDGLSSDGNIQVVGAGNTRTIGFNYFGSSKYNFYMDGTTDADKMFIRRGTTNVANFASNGDISFYEDTGTTPKLFWDASAESLGIGTSSPQALTHLYTESDINTADTLLKLTNVANTARYVGFQAQRDNASGQGLNILITKTDASVVNALTINTAANVGIGTSSPDTKLHLVDSTPEISLTRTSDFYYGRLSADGFSAFSNTNSNAPIIFKTATNERMRIDSSGNLLVGTTSLAVSSSTGSVTGTVINSSGLFEAAKTGTVMELNRLSADGDILNFRKDGTTVGSIGTTNSDLTIGTGDVGFRFRDGSNDILPFDVGSNSATDGVVSFGAASNRFKDLYLSGGVYLGGTGAANKLDDYEEGTWTPTAGAGGMTGTSITYTATYTKIGNTVTLSFKAYSTTGDIVVPNYQLWSGIPFTPTKTGTSTVITEDIDQFSRQGYASVGGTSFAVSACGSATGTNSLETSITYETA